MTGPYRSGRWRFPQSNAQSDSAGSGDCRRRDFRSRRRPNQAKPRVRACRARNVRVQLDDGRHPIDDAHERRRVPSSAARAGRAHTTAIVNDDVVAGTHGAETIERHRITAWFPSTKRGSNLRPDDPACASERMLHTSGFHQEESKTSGEYMRRRSSRSRPHRRVTLTQDTERAPPSKGHHGGAGQDIPAADG